MPTYSNNCRQPVLRHTHIHVTIQISSACLGTYTHTCHNTDLVSLSWDIHTYMSQYRSRQPVLGHTLMYHTSLTCFEGSKLNLSPLPLVSCFNVFVVTTRSSGSTSVGMASSDLPTPDLNSNTWLLANLPLCIFVYVCVYIRTCTCICLHMRTCMYWISCAAHSTGIIWH